MTVLESMSIDRKVRIGEILFLSSHKEMMLNN